MASVPSKGERLIAKVAFTPYMDKECTQEVLPVVPGPNGLRKTVQFPAFRETGEEVGYYTGASSEKGYEVEMVLRYKVAVQQFWGNWVNQDVIKFAMLWVKKDHVTGYWDKGVDSPLNDPKNPINTQPPPPKDNTNTFLLLAVGAGLFFKFVTPKMKSNGKN